MGRRTDLHTVEYRAGKISNEGFFLGQVLQGWDIRSVRIVRPGLLRRIGHGSGEGNEEAILGEEKGFGSHVGGLGGL